MKIDELDRLYIRINMIERIISFLYWMCIVLSIYIPLSTPSKKIQDIVNIVFTMAVVIHSLLSIYTSNILLNSVDSERRKLLLTNALGISLTHKTTQGYYNNSLKYSINRLGACIFESSFYTKEICKKMAINTRLKIIIYMTVWLITILNRNTDLSIILCFTQAVFSGHILIKWIKLELFIIRISWVYTSMYSFYLNKISSDSMTGLAYVLDLFASYETAKAAAAINKSRRVYQALSVKLSDEWEIINNKLNITDKKTPLEIGEY